MCAPFCSDNGTSSDSIRVSSSSTEERAESSGRLSLLNKG